MEYRSLIIVHPQNRCELSSIIDNPSTMAPLLSHFHFPLAHWRSQTRFTEYSAYLCYIHKAKGTKTRKRRLVAEKYNLSRRSHRCTPQKTTQVQRHPPSTVGRTDHISFKKTELSPEVF